MTIEEAINELENGEWWDLADVPCDTVAAIKFHAALDMAIPALRAQQTSNTPLTLEELREMDGEPVWVKSVNDDALFATRGWAIVTVLDNGDISLGFFGEDACVQTWILSEDSDEGADEEDEIEAIYRRKPEEEAK